jgi:hypothetical protein
MKQTWMWTIKLSAIIAIIVTAGIILPQQPAYAAATIEPIKIVSVEYYEEQIKVQNNGNSKICFATESDAVRGNWDVIDTDDVNNTTIDMSWLSSSSEGTILVKGYEDPTGTISRVIMKAKPKKLEVSINYENLDSLSANTSIASLVNIMTTEGTGEKPIDFTDLEWRKGETGQWKKTDLLTAGLVDKFLVKGTTLYFRICAVDDVVVGSDFPDGTEGRRFSNEVKVKIGKKSVASGYGIDGSRFTANIKYGNEYRVTTGNNTSTWIKIVDRSVKSTLLSTIVKSADGTTETKAFPEMKIEVRNYATSKSASSKITETSINAQRIIDEDSLVNGEAPPSAPTSNTNIYVSYNGNKNMILEIPSASTAQPFEYTVTKPNETLNLAKATWTSVTKGTEVKILATKAVEGGTLYIRMKEIKAKNATSTSNEVSFELASTYVSEEISYPSVPEIVDAAYVFTKGYSSDIPFTVTLNAEGKTPFEQTIKTIKLGTKEIKFDQSASTDPVTKVKTIAVKLKAESLETLANCYVKAITITYENGTIDKTSIKLTIQSPAAASALTVTHAKASTGGTAFSIITNKGIGNSWVYVKTASAITDVSIQDTVKTKTGIDLLPENNIPTATMDNFAITAGQYLTIFEVNTSGYIVKYKSIQITADYIR